MGPTTLTERDRQLLRRLAAGPRTPESLTEAVDEEPERIAERLDVLADSGVVRRIDETYELTDSGRRVLAAPGDGSADERIDVPVAVERELGSRSLGEPCAAAVRATYAVLQYWGEATASELRDAVFFERPAGYDDRHGWWTECVDPVLRTLPAVRPPDADSLAARWHYERPPGVDDAADGREVLGSTDDQPVGNARQATEIGTESALQRAAVRHGFAAIETRGQVTAEQLEREMAVAIDRELTPESTAAVFDLLEAVPSVERDDDPDGEWRYRHQSQ